MTYEMTVTLRRSSAEDLAADLMAVTELLEHRRAERRNAQPGAQRAVRVAEHLLTQNGA